ncbi:MAG: chemotaxis response regulator protein-glutamate methylesterase [Phycisphaerae bacterium]|jgi:two-component system chemotaxis response regulator CheB|nr:MAG: chemotaxis response regulator protein-glutamate methylesterase [Phycisphaerae bacterium]
MSEKIRVLVIDDSAVVRQMLTRELQKDASIEVVGTAPDPIVALSMIGRHRPNVLTLDVEMPRMDGITFLKKLMSTTPIPTIVLSSLTPQGSRTAIDAMAAGAVDVLCKPNGSYSIANLGVDLVSRVKLASRARLWKRVETSQPLSVVALSETTDKILAIGASTGGVQALTEVLTRFPANAPGTLIVQHMPPRFTASFAERLNTICKVRVTEAKEGDSVIPGHVLIAPGGYHMVLKRSGARYYVSITDGPTVHAVKPSVDVLFKTVAEVAGANAIGAILTGMGCDGAAGLLAMRQAGARTMAQDESSCVVFGMPMEAIKIGAAEKIVPLDEIARTMIQWSTSHRAVA